MSAFKKFMMDYKTLVVMALLFASTLSTGMVAVRYFYAGRLQFHFLVWNLFLAWLPLLFALLAYNFYRRWARFSAFACLWLLFLPNAPYLITDLAHLRWTSSVPVWYDAIMLFSFAMTGLLLGLFSLYLMQMMVERLLGRIASWLFVLASLGLSGFGVYIGRFLRWNSWDVFTNPAALFADLFNSLANPQFFARTIAISSLLCILFTVAYVVLFSLRFAAAPPDGRQAGAGASSRAPLCEL